MAISTDTESKDAIIARVKAEKAEMERDIKAEKAKKADMESCAQIIAAGSIHNTNDGWRSRGKTC